MNKVEKRLSDHNIHLEVTEPVKNYLAEKGYDADYGARPLRRVIQNEVEDMLSDGVLSGRFQDNCKIRIDLVEGKLDFTMVEEVIGSAENVEVTPVEQGASDGDAPLLEAALLS